MRGSPMWGIILFSVAGACAGAFAQDSVSRNANGGSGLPGDAVSPWGSAYQRLNYVVDMASLRTSWGTTFGIAPVMKSGKTSQVRFNAINGASTISPTVLVASTYPATTYTLWTLPGGGLNLAESNAALNSTVSPTGSPSVFCVASMDYEDVVSGTTMVLANQIYVGFVAFDPSRPDRLYVTRVDAGNNSPATAQADRSQFGLGTVDANGNVVFRADGFGVAGTTAPLTQDTLFRIDAGARSANVLNTIDTNGGSAAGSTTVLLRSATSLAVPCAIPKDIAGRSVAIEADFAGRCEFESSTATFSTTFSHLAGGIGDHRGTPSFSGRRLLQSGVGTCAVLGRSAAGGGRVDTLNLWSVDASGTPLVRRALTLPASISDPCDAFVWPLSGGGFRNYDSQVTFRGGSGPVALGHDLAGNSLGAATLYAGTTPNPSNGTNAIVVARFDGSNPGSAVQWANAAWVDASTLTGKPIYADYGADGLPNTGDAGENDGVVDGQDGAIGRLAALSETALGPVGPSISAPAFDEAGNVYFLAGVAIKRAGGTGVVFDYSVGLVRAVLDPGTMCYKLDLVCRPGDVFVGRNAGRNYQIASLFLADGDSISSSALWSGSAIQQSWNAVPTGSLAQAAPQHLAGLTLSARIVYDTNGDGQFIDPTLPGSDANSADEAYNVVLLIANTTPPPPSCDPDYNQDGGADLSDVLDLANDIASGTESFPPNSPDFNNDGSADVGDVIDLANVVAGGPCP